MSGGWPDLRASYDSVAREYAEAFAGELAGKPFDRGLLEEFTAALPAGAVVADLGCGPAAQIGAYVAGLCPPGRLRVVGLDLSPVCCTLAPLPSAAGDLATLPLRDASLDGACAFYSLIHLPRALAPTALLGMRRVLRPGGRLVVTVHEGVGEHAQQGFLGKDVPFRATLFEQSELQGLLTDAGFADVRVARRAPYEGEHPTHRLYATARRP